MKTDGCDGSKAMERASCRWAHTHTEMATVINCVHVDLPPAPAVSRPTWESGKAPLYAGNALLVWKTAFYRRSRAGSGPTPNPLGTEQRPL